MNKTHLISNYLFGLICFLPAMINFAHADTYNPLLLSVVVERFDGPECQRFQNSERATNGDAQYVCVLPNKYRLEVSDGDDRSRLKVLQPEANDSVYERPFGTSFNKITPPFGFIEFKGQFAWAFTFLEGISSGDLSYFFKHAIRIGANGACERNISGVLTGDLYEYLAQSCEKQKINQNTYANDDGFSSVTYGDLPPIVTANSSIDTSSCIVILPVKSDGHENNFDDEAKVCVGFERYRIRILTHHEREYFTIQDGPIEPENWFDNRSYGRLGSIGFDSPTKIKGEVQWVFDWPLAEGDAAEYIKAVIVPVQTHMKKGPVGNRGNPIMTVYDVRLPPRKYGNNQRTEDCRIGFASSRIEAFNMIEQYDGAKHACGK